MRDFSRRRCLTLSALAAAVYVSSVVSGFAEDRPTQKVKVFTFATKEAAGFVDPRAQDLEMTVKDVREAVTKKKNSWLQIVETPEQADVILEVTARKLVERSPTVASATTTTTYSKDGKTATSTTTAPTKEHDVVLNAVMRVGDYSNELTGVCDLGYIWGGPYRKAAQDLVGELEKWVKANYTRLQLKPLR